MAEIPTDEEIGRAARAWLKAKWEAQCAATAAARRIPGFATGDPGIHHVTRVREHEAFVALKHLDRLTREQWSYNETIERLSRD